MNNKWRGICGESFAILYLLIKRYKIIAWNYRKGKTEIDIIAAKGETIIFVEVKYRNKLDDFAQPVSYAQINRIKRGAHYYLQDKTLYKLYPYMRFDLIIVTQFIRLKHFMNIWTEG